MIKHLRLPKWNEILLEIYSNRRGYSYCQKLNKSVRGSIGYIGHMVKALARKNLVRITPKKNINRLELTDKGKKVASAIFEIKTEIDGYEFTK